MSDPIEYRAPWDGWYWRQGRGSHFWFNGERRCACPAGFKLDETWGSESGKPRQKCLSCSNLIVLRAQKFPEIDIRHEMSRHPSEFIGIHKGETAWLLGNGPSLLEWTMEEFRELGDRVIGINKSWLGREENDHGPAHPGFQGTDYHCFVSGANVDEVFQGKVQTRVVFLPDRMKWALFRTENRFKGHWSALRPRAGSSASPFSTDLTRGYDSNFAGYMAVQIAAAMGFSRICLVGYDCNDFEGHHWDKNPKDGAITRNGMIPWFREFHAWASTRKDLSVINCSTRSAIPYFPKSTKEETREWLMKARVERPA